MTIMTHPLTCSAETVAQNQKGHQGFKNYPTWAVHLWVAEEPQWQYRIAEAVLRNIGRKETAAFKNTDAIRDIIEEDLYEFDGDGKAPTLGLAADLFKYAFEEVDWFEIAQVFMEYSKEELEMLASELSR